MSSIFELSVSKLGYMAIHVKILGNKFWPIFRAFLTNRGKNESEGEKIWENEFDFWILHIKIRLYGTFHKNLRKNIFFEIFTWKGHTRTEVSRVNWILRQIFCISSISFEDLIFTNNKGYRSTSDNVTLLKNISNILLKSWVANKATVLAGGDFSINLLNFNLNAIEITFEFKATIIKTKET